MSRGIIVFGAMGVGDTTLGKEVAKRLNYPHFDIDDYHWRWDTEIPYTKYRSRDEKTALLMNAILREQHFVMSGSMWSIRKSFEPLFDMAVFMTAPAEVRAERIKTRSITRWGNRVLPGGDMYKESDVYQDYLFCAKKYDTAPPSEYGLAQHEQWAQELPCSVLRLDGTKPIAENAELVIEQYNKMFQLKSISKR